MEQPKKFKSFAEIKKIFVQNFFKCCDENKLSLSMISELTKVSKSNLHNYRYNNKPIGGNKIVKMTDACKIEQQKVFTLSF